MLDPNDRIVVTGSAGLVGQNLVTLLREEGFANIVAIDKHEANLATQKRLHPGVDCVLADLAERGSSERQFAGAAVVPQLHAQIAGLSSEPFDRNNIVATKNVLDVIHREGRPFIVHASSSVVNSAVDDDHTGLDIARVFGFAPTHFRKAIEETYGHPVYSKVALESPH